MAGRYEKKLDVGKFLDGYNKYAAREVSMRDAAKIAGISYPTFRKHLATLWTTGELHHIFTDPNAFISLGGIMPPFRTIEGEAE